MKVLLAVSGGIDSMYMANKAPELFPGASFAVAHCNFGLRSEESDGDEQFVREWASKQGMPLFVKRFDTREYAASKHISIEMAARELRYDWFAQLCREQGFDAVSVAHNANDNAETLMLNLLRGTGSKGLRGMSGSSSVNGLTILRPLLGTERREISEWMQSKGFGWREDRSNSENVYKRNSIRNEVFPVFGRINPSFLGTLGSDMQHFRDIDDIADDYYRKSGFDPGSIDLGLLTRDKHWKYLLFRLTEGKLSAAQLNSLQASVQSGNQLNGKRFGPYVVSGMKLVEHNITEGDGCMVVEGPGTYSFNGRSFRIEEIPALELESARQPEGIIVADSSVMKFPFLLRGWKAGDYLNPLGMNGKKKLSDLFVDIRQGADKKDSAVVAVCPEFSGEDGSHVAALLCLRIDKAVRISEKASSVVRITEVYSSI
ncbi:MAG: tRNA lysidine(34) synthetase TilS [Bacteroidales bacterium]|nr:tRNA lysidine(34) synthetase TilS [Bacteroidales bacterium]